MTDNAQSRPASSSAVSWTINRIRVAVSVPIFAAGLVLILVGSIIAGVGEKHPADL